MMPNDADSTQTPILDELLGKQQSFMPHQSRELNAQDRCDFGLELLPFLIEILADQHSDCGSMDDEKSRQKLLILVARVLSELLVVDRSLCSSKSTGISAFAQLAVHQKRTSFPLEYLLLFMESIVCSPVLIKDMVDQRFVPVMIRLIWQNSQLRPVFDDLLRADHAVTEQIKSEISQIRERKNAEAVNNSLSWLYALCRNLTLIIAALDSNNSDESRSTSSLVNFLIEKNSSSSSLPSQKDLRSWCKRLLHSHGEICSPVVEQLLDCYLHVNDYITDTNFASEQLLDNLKLFKQSFCRLIVLLLSQVYLYHEEPLDDLMDWLMQPRLLQQDSVQRVSPSGSSCTIFIDTSFLLDIFVMGSLKRRLLVRNDDRVRIEYLITSVEHLVDEYELPESILQNSFNKSDWNFSSLVNISTSTHETHPDTNVQETAKGSTTLEALNAIETAEQYMYLSSLISQITEMLPQEWFTPLGEVQTAPEPVPADPKGKGKGKAKLIENSSSNQKSKEVKFGEGFIEACLIHYNYDVERVLQAILLDADQQRRGRTEYLEVADGALDSSLQKLARTLPRKPQPVIAEIPIVPKHAETLPTYDEATNGADLSLVDTRRNIFDNDAFDVFAGNKELSLMNQVVDGVGKIHLKSSNRIDWSKMAPAGANITKNYLATHEYDELDHLQFFTSHLFSIYADEDEDGLSDEEIVSPIHDAGDEEAPKNLFASPDQSFGNEAMAKENEKAAQRKKGIELDERETIMLSYYVRNSNVFDLAQRGSTERQSLLKELNAIEGKESMSHEQVEGWRKMLERNVSPLGVLYSTHSDDSCGSPNVNKFSMNTKHYLWSEIDNSFKIIA